MRGRGRGENRSGKSEHEGLEGHDGGDPDGTPGCTSQFYSSVTELLKIGTPSPEASVAPSVKWSHLSGMTLTAHQDP